MFVCRLELVEIVMALVAPVGYRSFSRRQDLVNKGTFAFLAAGQKNLAGNAAIEIKAEMCFGLFGAFAVLGPVHGEHGVNERTVDGDQSASFRVMVWEQVPCLLLQSCKEQQELFEPALIHGLEKRTFSNAFFGAMCSLAKVSSFSDWSRCLPELCSVR